MTMSPLVATLASLLAVTVVVVPVVVGARRYPEMVDPATTPARRRELRIRGLVRTWVIFAAVVAVSVAGPFPLQWAPVPAGIPIVVALAIGSVAGVVLVTRSLRSADGRSALARASAKFAGILPRTRSERALFAVVAVTAGITEEVAYRGFLIAYLVWLLPGGNQWVAALVAGVAFGFAHAYQGWRGIAQTAFIGIAFGLIYPSVGLVALIVVHAIIDLRLLLLPIPEGPVDASDVRDADGSGSAAPASS